MTLDDHDLFKHALAAIERAHCPYSSYPVGAAMRTGSGRIYTGCNIENASYGLTMCAERVAIFAAVAAEGSGLSIQHVVVTSPGTESCAPCGACRQVLAEFAPEATVSFKWDGLVVQQSCSQLLPYAFAAEDVTHA